MNANWIDDILADCEHVETPRAWIWWSLISAVSAVSANYSLPILKGTVRYRPNLYVMLLGKSGLGKGFGINLAKLLVQKADTTRVIAGRSSIQAIVTELSQSKSRPDGKPAFTDSRGFIINGELSAAIISDVEALAILTDLYDGHYNPEWANLLKTTGKEQLKKPYIVTLFGSSPEHFYDKIPEANIAGGYIARNLMVYEEKRYKDVDLLDGDESDDPDYVHDYLVPKYSKHLIKISSGGGTVRYNPLAKGLFNEWRRDWRSNQRPDRTGFANRAPDHALKTAICLCLSRYDSDLIINEEEMATAIEKVVNLTIRVNQEIKNQDSNLSTHSQTVLNLLIQAEDNQLPRKLLLSRAYPHGLCESAVLDNIIGTLLEMEWVSRERIGVGAKSDWLIKLSGEPLEKLNAWRKSRDK